MYLFQKFFCLNINQYLTLNYQVLKDVLKQTKSVRFEGNNYSKEWQDEANKRKLFQVTNTPDAITQATY